MIRACASRTAFDALRIFVLFVGITLAAMAPQAMAQENVDSGGNADQASAGLPLSQLADLLENDQARDKIVTQLRDAAQAGSAAPMIAPPSEKAGDEASADAPGAASSEKATASKQRVSFARRFAQTTADWAEVIGERVTKTWTMLASLNAKRGPGPAFDTAAFLAAATVLALVALATVLSFFVLRFLASWVFDAIGRFSQRSESGSGVLIRRGTAIVLGILIDAAIVLLACGAGYLAGVSLIGETGSIATRASLFINAFALIELAKVAIRAVFAARYDSLRLLNIPASIAGWWSIRLRWFVGIIGYGLLVAVPIVNQQLSFFVGAAVSFALMGGAYVYALSVIFKNRRLFTERLKRMSENASVGFFGVLFTLASKLWVIIAVAYFTTLFVSSQTDPTGALPFMLSATLQTLVAAAIGFGISGLLSKAIGRRFALSEGMRDKLPMLEARLNSYVPNALKFIRLVILAVFALVVANAWHLFDLGEWLASDAGLNTVSLVTRVAIVLAAAAFLWVVAASLIEHRLNPNTGGGKPTARQETLLELFRNALAILIITMTLMIALSQIGVDIGPLIAGAGVLGLAIGFGAQSLVQDIITGVFIQLENAMNTGDVVTVGGITGTAEKLTIRSVSIRDLDGAYHIVPFSAASTVTNYMREFAYHRTEYSIAFREDIDNAIYHLREAFAELKADPIAGANLLEDIAVPGVTSIGNASDGSSATMIRVMIKTKPGAQWGVGRAFNRLVKMHFDRAGIEIPYPHQTLYFGEDRDGKAAPAKLRVLEGPRDGGESAPEHARRKGDDAAPEETGDAPG